MDELVSIVQERRTCIQLLNSQEHSKHKSLFLEEERKRHERENWLLRVLKTLKVLTIEQKKAVIGITVQLMNFYYPTQPFIENYERINFIQTFINLFVQFYNKFEGLDLSHIKTIIRPNNSYIMVDLLKSLIELSRKEFKSTVQRVFKEALPIKSERNYSYKIDKAEQGRNASSGKPDKNEDRQKCRKGEGDSRVEIGKKIEACLYEKYSKVIQNYNTESIHQKFNQTYFDLLYMNQKNGAKIQKYLDSCFGVKRHINYDVAGLYTQQQIAKMMNQQKEKAEYRAAELRELYGDCSAEQLKEYFKIKIEIHEAQNNLMVKKASPIRPWFPITMVKNGDKLHPFTQSVQVNGSSCSCEQFEEKNNKKLKYYLKQRLNQWFGVDKQLRYDNDIDKLSFNKREYIDFGNQKLLQLLHKEIPAYVAKKQKERDKQRQKERQGTLPPINLSQSEETSTRPSKAKSDSKLPGASLVLPYSKASQNISRILQRRMNLSSLQKQNPVSKKNIDNLIDKIIKSREYTIH